MERMSPSGNSCDTKDTNFYQQAEEISSCDMTDAPAVARTAWNYGGISVQVNIKCSDQSWKKKNAKFVNFKLTFWPVLNRH